ncbi:MAG: amidase [Kordiimonadaceae bacterium]|nr:amidase [Kordiimonadaceae bacterium]
MSGIHFKQLTHIAQSIKARKLSPVEITDSLLARIEALNPTFHAYSHVMVERARTQAAKAEQEIIQGDYKGPLHGVPIAIKDLLDIAGEATACGSTIKQGAVASRNAGVVDRLQNAGAIIVGKLNMTEFALSGYHPDLPVPVNPWGADRWAGVSSSGSAIAAATGLAYGTLGSDTGGSIRFPSAVNGVVGIKPTFGTISKHGAFPLAYTLDHIGPITRSVEDAALMLQAIAGFDAGDPFSRRGAVPNFTSKLTAGVKGLRVGIDDAYCATNAHPEVTAAVHQAAAQLAKLGAKLVPVNIMAVLETCAYWGAVVAAEAAIAHAETFPSQAADYGPVFRAALEAAPSITGSDYARSRLAVARASAAFRAAFDVADVLLCPGAPLPAMPLDEFPADLVLPPEEVAAFVGFAAPMNFTGHPTISVPCGMSSEGLPLGLQFVGRHNDEATLIGAAYAYEQATEWHTLIPNGLKG